CSWRACCVSWPPGLRPCTSTGRNAATSTLPCSVTDKGRKPLFFGRFGGFRSFRLVGSDLSGEPLDDCRRYDRSPGKLRDGSLQAAGESPGGLRPVDCRAAAFDVREERPCAEYGPGR